MFNLFFSDQWLNKLAKNGSAQTAQIRGVKFPQNLLTPMVLIFHLDAKMKKK